MLTQFESQRMHAPERMKLPAVALVAHDRMKQDLLALVEEYAQVLSRFAVIATRDTGHLLVRQTRLSVTLVGHGPFGGDIEVAALAVTGELAAVVFLRDPMGARSDEPPLDAVLRACDLHNVPHATNTATARAVFARLEVRAPALVSATQGA